jgi:DNA modification methylase
MGAYKNRIIGSGEESLDDILFNPRNWRIHPLSQQDALKGILEEVGWVQQVIINKRTGNLVDGHLRCQLAAREGNKTIPVLYVDIDEAEELLVLATLDPIAGMAATDKAKLDKLFQDINSDNENVQKLISEIAEKEKLDYSNSDAKEEARKTLAERFIVPPFSVLDARQGYWQERKRAWVALGIESEVGRDNNLLKMSTTVAPDGQTSLFDPVLCELVYRWFMPAQGSVLDPFAGGSVRGIVAAKLGHKYTGIDLSARQIEANRVQADELLTDNKPTWIVGDSKHITELAPGEYDLIFSCPPYADLEVYSDDPNDLSTMEYPDFKSVYHEIVYGAVAMLKQDRFACFVVGDIRDKKGFYRNFVSDTIEAFQDAGATLYNEAILVTAVGSLPIRVSKQFNSGRKLGKTHQNVLIFYKGDPKAIKTWGDVECGDIEDESAD